MKASEQLVKEWRSVSEQGDNKELCNLLNKQAATVSRIVNGKQETTFKVLLQIKEYYSKRIKSVKKLQGSVQPLDQD